MPSRGVVSPGPRVTTRDTDAMTTVQRAQYHDGGRLPPVDGVPSEPHRRRTLGEPTSEPSFRRNLTLVSKLRRTPRPTERVTGGLAGRRRTPNGVCDPGRTPGGSDRRPPDGRMLRVPRTTRGSTSNTTSPHGRSTDPAVTGPRTVPTVATHAAYRLGDGRGSPSRRMATVTPRPLGRTPDTPTRTVRARVPGRRLAPQDRHAPLRPSSEPPAASRVVS